MTRWFAALTLLAIPLALLPGARAGKKSAESAEESKEALQNLQEFIGGWKGAGTSEKDKAATWKETANWSWRFKGGDVSMSVDMPASKFFKSGELRWLPAKERYQLDVTDKDGKHQVYEGQLKKNVLTLQRVNPQTKETEQIKMNTAGGGDRLITTFLIKPENRTMFFKQYQIGYTKEGVTFGVEAGGKRPECVVTGGLGTMAVSFNGQTYYVCCSGCRDAFNDNPAKIIAEWKTRKKSGQ